MTTLFQNDAEKQNVWETVQTINRLWSKEQRPEALRDFFHSGMVAVCGGEAIIRKDGAACLEGWTWFAKEATDIQFVEQDPHITIHLDGTVAVVAYFFDCSYKMNGVAVTMKGRDMFTLIKISNRWHVVANHFSPLP